MHKDGSGAPERCVQDCPMQDSVLFWRGRRRSRPRRREMGWFEVGGVGWLLVTVGERRIVKRRRVSFLEMWDWKVGCVMDWCSD